MVRRIAALLGVAALVLVASPAAVAQNFVPITGSGSTWSQNALDQWRRNVDNLYGMRVDFAGGGSSKGRADFKFQQTNFAVSEIPYGLTDNNVRDDPPKLDHGQEGGYAYMPIVAGGTAFMYNLKIGNNRVTNLRLSGEVLAKIFTRQITNWSDPAIKADNPTLALPARPIVPVARSDGSGTTAQFTTWLSKKYQGIWDSFCGRPNCGFTSNYPSRQGIEAKSGSDGVANFVRQGSSEGTITYVEYSYAKNASFPVVKVLNEAGYYIEPTAASVAVALLQAQIRPDLTQELSNVYGRGDATDKRSYPLSSYSYLILPTQTNSRTTEAHGRTLSEFAYYFLCEGQQYAESLGYSPLPVNLVAEGVKQAAKIPGSTNKIPPGGSLSRCNNPTVSPTGGNKLAESAPNPPECDKKGVTQCATGTGGAKQDTPTTGGGGAGGGGTGGGGTGGGGAGGDAAGNGQTPGSTAIDPDTGLPVGGNGTAQAANVSAIPVQVALPSGRQRLVLTIFAVILLSALVLGPALVSRFLNRRRGRQ